MIIFLFGTETKWALNNYVAFLNTFIYPLLKLVLRFGHDLLLGFYCIFFRVVQRR